MLEKPQRRDAAERRKAILAAAEMAFAEKGLDVPLEEICVAAGVGRATLYRNFENRIALVHALMSANVEKLAALADSAAARPDGLRIYLAEILDQLVKTGGLVHLIGLDPQLDHDLSRRVLAHIERLLAGAQSAGVVRADVTSARVNMVIRMMSGGLNGLSFAERRRIGPEVFELCMAALGMAQPSDAPAG
jgi:Transcriptional regulator